MNLGTTIEISAGGPGSGRHPEHGKFKPSESNDDSRYNLHGNLKRYSTDKTQITVQHNSDTGRTHISESSLGSAGKGMTKRERVGYSMPRDIGSGTKEQATKFLKVKYGIDHNYD